MKNYLNFPHNKEKILRIHQGTNNCNWEYREFVDCRHKVFNCILAFNPIPTGHGRNQPIYERHVTKSGRDRVNGNDRGMNT